MKALIETRISILEIAYQKVIAGDGTEQIVEREKESGYYYADVEHELIFSEELGYGYKKDGMLHFRGISDRDINFCIQRSKIDSCVGGWTKEDFEVVQ